MCLISSSHVFWFFFFSFFFLVSTTLVSYFDITQLLQSSEATSSGLVSLSLLNSLATRVMSVAENVPEEQLTVLTLYIDENKKMSSETTRPPTESLF